MRTNTQIVWFSCFKSKEEVAGTLGVSLRRGGGTPPPRQGNITMIHH